MTDEKKQNVSGDDKGAYTVDMDEIDGLGDLSDLDIESFMNDATPEPSVVGETVVGERAAPQMKTDDDPFASLENGDDKSPVSVDDGSMDRIHPPSKKTTAGSPEHLAKLQDQLARLAADFDNFRKRSKRETEEAVKYANEGILRALLPIMDNLKRALESGGDAAATISGVNMVSTQFSQDLRRFGLKAFDATGEKFDPKAHEAFEMVESSEHEAGTVVRVYQSGYWMHDRLLRPAMVSVAKAIPSSKKKAEKPEPTVEVETEPETTE